MMFVIDKPRLRRIIAIVRDDRTPKTQWAAGPFLRLEARDDKLTLSGLQASATIPATVYEPGVLFLKVTLFRRLLGTITNQETITIQANKDGLLLDNVTLPLEANDMLLYADSDQAPERHPEDDLRETQEAPAESSADELPLWKLAEDAQEPAQEDQR